ncbi:SMI1/KNR4 family protein [Azospirillum picis]|uniref:Knr4/Smi1-like domain-containing protein n=1 Tax=Azospirillum picis TaxID=488438 RepID=A0ABU0MIQ2_9PROT|nr:SMI1/KNR4 family protein [Azospirillum picis]MBP2299233.1 hypothetical protein [Azospirillum picis]MDQ0533129.1 hypothetical protein [Azospirillum picis]
MLTWKYVKNTVSSDDITAIERDWGITFGRDYVVCVLENNGGRPTPNGITTPSGQERIFERLLSLNPKDKDNVHGARHGFATSVAQANLFPFGMDPFGNLFCFRGLRRTVKDVVFWNHETDVTEVLCGTFSELLAALR